MSNTEFKQKMEHLEKTLIFNELIKNKFNQVHTSRELGINRLTLKKKIEKYGLESPVDKKKLLRDASDEIRSLIYGGKSKTHIVGVVRKMFKGDLTREEIRELYGKCRTRGI